MKTKSDGEANAGQPYTQDEVDLILSILPTHENVARIASSLGRTREAIYFIYLNAYSGQWLKSQLAQTNEKQDNVFTKIGKAKSKVGLAIGHMPK